MEHTEELSAYDIAYNKLIVHGWATYTDSEYIREVLKALQIICSDNTHESHTGPVCARVVLEWAAHQSQHARDCREVDHVAHLKRSECALSLIELSKLLR